MDAFLAKLSYHATSYAVRSCIALTSTYVIKQGAQLLKTIDYDPLRAELSQLQRRLTRKIELVSPILESIELRYTRGDSALETVVRTARGLREDIDALGERLKHATSTHSSPLNGARDSKAAVARREAELAGIIGDIKDLTTSIDDAIPLINLWVSAIGGIQAPESSFSPSRLLQASMLVNVGDTQFILDPSQPMQIGPDFILSLYMLFRGHASAGGAQEPYGVEEGQRKPMWQEVMHKARVRLLRISLDELSNRTSGSGPRVHYAYQLQVVEDLDDGRLHTFENRDSQPAAYDGLSSAGIRELIPIHQISKMFYADVGKILNINSDDGASNRPVLLIKRDTEAIPVVHGPGNPTLTIKGAEDSVIPNPLSLEGDSQECIDSQLRQEMGLPNERSSSQSSQTHSKSQNWSIPQDLDPEWIALEVFDVDDNENTLESDSDSDSDTMSNGKDSISNDDDDGACRPRHTTRPSIDLNLITQLNRMNIASRPSSSDSQQLSITKPHSRPASSPHKTTTNNNNLADRTSTTNLIERSPFGAIKTSLSLLEMLLRLTSLQEFEQTTHLAIPDHVLKFYLDESVSSSGLHGKERLAASAEAQRKVGFDPYADPSV
ncbi:RanGTP-binding protein-domain-containing protein [Xylaria bambusicola]|uniref:RanGTP-binding protein-domain-containing protein n=1 Tax=Xylaria bambusicola TaxID=326684 RepID=UPI002008407A|nr:RanGTP-binding protein-domain-containing protein [Xylaria bambusicola]KAI0509691.1 RanGTP-binding protein-domain-containing protein [Xylaria bambusicola]